MKKAHEKALEEVKRKISDAIEPKKMSVAEARVWLEELKADLDIQIECLPKDD